MSRLFVAVELGEELGRILLGTLHKGQLTVSEAHRFHNVPIRDKKEVLWDVAQIYQDTLSGLLAVGLYEEPVDGISCTSWADAYLLFHSDASFIPPTRHHTDPRIEEGRKEVLAKVSRAIIFEETGTADGNHTTLMQLGSEKSRHLKRADHLMPVADGLNFLLSGAAHVEASSASATQLFNPRTRYWSQSLCTALGLPANLLPVVVPAGTKLKPIRPELALATKLEGAHIVASCSNELAAALASLPVQPDEHWAFLRLGTKAAAGTPVSEPVITPTALESGFRHTLGHGNAIYGHLEFEGLQILEEFRQIWGAADPNMDDGALSHLAATAEPLESIVDLTDPRFVSPDDLVIKIQAYCRETGQTVPRKPGALYRCLMESLALLFRRKLDELSVISGREISHVHLIGDSRNNMLVHFIANAVQLPVLVAPPNAAALGNILVQALALGKIKDLDEANLINTQSFKRPLTLPNPAATWAPAYDRLCQLSAASAETVQA
jgi:rhamnulokinase